MCGTDASGKMLEGDGRSELCAGTIRRDLRGEICGTYRADSEILLG